MTKEKKKVEVKAAEDAVEEQKLEQVDTLTEWQKKVEADLNAMAERCYEKRYLQINSDKPGFVQLNKGDK